MTRCAAALAAVVMLLGCRKNIETNEAVRQGILDYLSKRPDLNSMNVNVTAVSFRKDEADATVYFSGKGGPPGNGMQLKYILKRQDDHWVVTGRDTTGNPHGAGVPEGALPLPEGHPAIPQQVQPQQPPSQSGPSQ